MILEEALTSALVGHAGLSALIGDRVYPNQIPQGKALPAISYQRVSTLLTETMDCPDSSTIHARIQIDVVGRKYLEVKAVAQQLRKAMQSSSDFKAVKITDRDFPSQNPDIRRVLLEFNVWFQEQE